MKAAVTSDIWHLLLDIHTSAQFNISHYTPFDKSNTITGMMCNADEKFIEFCHKGGYGNFLDMLLGQISTLVARETKSEGLSTVHLVGWLNLHVCKMIS